MAEWKVVKLADVCTVLNGRAYSQPELLNSGKYKVVRVGNLVGGDRFYYSDMELDEDKYCLEGDLLYAWACSFDSYIWKEGKTIFHYHIWKLLPKEDLLDKKFFYFYLKRLTQKLLGKTNGSVMQHITKNLFENTVFPLPSLPTQQKIAAILSSLDDKIELNNKINTNLEQQIKALLLDYLSKKETSSVKLGDYLYIKGRIGWKGLKKNEYLSESKYRIINGETLTKSGIDWNKAGYISEERYTESPEIMLQVGDILLSKDGTIGKIGYVDELELPTSVASGIFVIRNNNPSEISTTFIYYLLKSKLFDSFIIARTEGSVIPHLYQKDFMDFEFPLPSPELMNDFEQTTSPMFYQITNNLKENKKLISLRDSLLPKLMNGEIEV